MTQLVALIILVGYLIYFGNCGTLPASQQAEQTLITSLLSGYNKNIRPDDTVEIQMTATILQIVSIDEKQQIMTSSVYISQSWFDDRLSWLPNSTVYNFRVVMLPVKSLWIPDTIIVNSADTSGYLPVSDYSLASVDYTGLVYMIIPALTIKTRCSFALQKFPFDSQICSINLTSWSQGANRLLYDETRDTVIDISGYTEHPLWKLNYTDMVVIRGADRVPLEDTYNSIISIQLYLQRKPLFFMVNGIFACLVLNVVTLLSFSLPFGSQIGLAMTSFMTYSVYSLNFSNLFPQQSEYIMMITLFFLLSIGWTLVAMSWFILCNYYTTKAEMPQLLYDFGCQLQKVFFCCFPPPKKDDSAKNNKKDAVVENGEIKNTTAQKTGFISCPEIFNSCCCKKSKVGNADKNQGTVVEDVDTNKTNGTITKSTEVETNAKTKCNFCDRCESCQADFDKDKSKGKNKKNVEASCNALNYLIFFILTICIFTSNMAVWLTMSQ